jgi:pimeloyl-ACP methyl ester carboxylesterase
MQDAAGDYLALQQSWRISLWHRLSEFVHSHLTEVWKVVIGVAVPVALVAIPAVRAPLATVALDFPKPVCGKVENTKLLLFVHGWYGGSDGTWQRFPELACPDDRLTDVDIIAVNYPTFAARRNLSVAQLADWLNSHLDFGKNGKYQRVVIIAHSMGGLLSREIVILRSLGEPHRN